jgi:translation initiation factor 1 (eIF-1/SUI1)
MDGPSIYSPANRQLANHIIQNKQIQTTAFDAEDCVTIMEMMEAGEARMKKLARLFKSRVAKCCGIDKTRARKAELCVKTEKSPNGGKTLGLAKSKLF